MLNISGSNPGKNDTVLVQAEGKTGDQVERDTAMAKSLPRLQQADGPGAQAGRCHEVRRLVEAVGQRQRRLVPERRRLSQIFCRSTPENTEPVWACERPRGLFPFPSNAQANAQEVRSNAKRR